jgi:hypothetical protein
MISTRDIAMPKYRSVDPLYTKALSEALKGIYRVYGSNLSAFFRDVRDEEDEPLTRAGNERQVQLYVSQAQRRRPVKASR